jgi:hypothetical protein
MIKGILLALSFITSLGLFGGFMLSGSSPKGIRVHSRDLPEEGLVIVRPSDASFSAKFAKEMEGQSQSTANLVQPFSVFLENRSEQTVVAYMIQWCFTRSDGANDCYRKAFVAPRALMDGAKGTAEDEARSGTVKPNSSVFLSLISPDGRGSFRVRVPTTREEAEKIKQGATPDLTQRVQAELARYTDVVVTIDGAFFDDGSFVGDDVSGFFDQINAQVKAKYDLLSEVKTESDKPQRTHEEIFHHVEDAASQNPLPISPQSNAADHYSYYKQFYAHQILSSRQILGDEKALQRSLGEIKKAWPTLRKREKKST